jgi:uncharacterized protein YkwD
MLVWKIGVESALLLFGIQFALGGVVKERMPADLEIRSSQPVLFSELEPQNADEIEIGKHLENRQATLTADQSGALNAHNVGRIAMKIAKLSWDANLTQNAQTWANNLAEKDLMKHSSSSQRPGQGENLARASLVSIAVLKPRKACF